MVSQAEPPGAPSVAGSAPGISCALTLPESPSAVQVRVFDGGAVAGLAEDTATQLRVRGFAVMAGAAGEGTADAAALTYGPAAVGAAHLVRQAVSGEVVMRFDSQRRDQVVDLTIGAAFDRLATAAELNQNLAAAGEPSAPPECR